MSSCPSRPISSLADWECLLLSDFHGRVHKTLAKQLAKALEPHQPLFIEEPLLPGHVPEMEKLYQKTSIPIAVSLQEAEVHLACTKRPS